MKKWFLIIISILLVVLIGIGMITLHGHGELNYQAGLQHGRFAVIDRKYGEALNYFQGARKVNPDSNQVSRDLSQTQSFISGNHYLNRYRLGLAAKNYHRAVRVDAISALNRRASKRYKTVTAIRQSSARFTKWYQQALVLNHQRKFKASARHLSRIKADPNLNMTYFRKFRAKVKRLLSADHKDDRSHQVTATVGKRSNEQAFKLKTPRIVSEHPNKVTVAKARHEIQRAGVNAREMSNGDVINLIRQARQHNSSVKHYAKKNY